MKRFEVGRSYNSRDPQNKNTITVVKRTDKMLYIDTGHGIIRRKICFPDGEYLHDELIVNYNDYIPKKQRHSLTWSAADCVPEYRDCILFMIEQAAAS